VSSSALRDGPDSLPEKEIARLQRPYGGVVCAGRSGALRASTRGALEGAGTWTHACADPGNTMNSGDTIVKAPLGMLWYEDETMPTVSRHGKGPAPLFCQGILLREGIDAMKAIDAYNGRTLWQVPLPGVVAYLDVDSSVGTAATGGTYCVAHGVVYVRRDNYCLLLDVLTGKQIARLDAPRKPDGQPGTWTVIACKDGILFGALANEQYIIKSVHGLGYEKNQVPMDTMFTESSLLFALDAKTGAVKWTWQPEQSIRNNAIAIGSGRVFLIDRVPAEIDKILKSDVRERRGKKLPLPKHPTGVLVALDAETGKVLWRNPEDIYGTTLSYSEKHDVLIMSYRGSWALPSEFARRSLGAFQGATGKWLWNIRPKRAAPRPIIHERTLYYFPYAYDLLTGKAKENLAIQGKSFGCTPMMGSANLILTRSGTVSYYDLLYNCGWLEDYGGMRPGCWVNMLPVGGLVLIPDDTSGCRCSYLNQANVALKEYGVRPPLVLPKACSFKNKLTVTITHPDRSVEIRYTLDDSYPTVQSPLYTAPLTLTKTTTLRAAISQNGYKLSDRDAITYTKE